MPTTPSSDYTKQLEETVQNLHQKLEDTIKQLEANAMFMPSWYKHVLCDLTKGCKKYDCWILSFPDRGMDKYEHMIPLGEDNHDVIHFPILIKEVSPKRYEVYTFGKKLFPKENITSLTQACKKSVLYFYGGKCDFNRIMIDGSQIYAIL
jgi:hypothetical protein